jgi:Rho GTPase-activating protein RGD1
LKKRSTLEEEHANGLRKICRITHENLRRPEHRQGSFAQSYDDITRIHERMADNGIQFAASLHQMHEDLLEMASNIERGRKHWKQTGLTAEQRLADTEAAMRKSKAKYDAVADDYDRARTGVGQSGKKFGLKGPKSAAQHEEDLLRKVQAADGDYASKVQLVQSTRAEHLTKGRPDTIKSIQDLIRECDSALTLQMQKFGKSVSPRAVYRADVKKQHSTRSSYCTMVLALVRSKDMRSRAKNRTASAKQSLPLITKRI